jgi:SAM-dependent MidA family methyltransferase
VSRPPLYFDDAAQRHQRQVAAHLRHQIAQADGWLSFERWMAEALYAPGLGYYAAGSVKLDDTGRLALPAGDFVTAPTLTPLYGRTLSRQVAQVLQHTDTTDILEFGAGTGTLANNLLLTLDSEQLPVHHYYIVEVSADLRQRQQKQLAHYGNRVIWLDTLPAAFNGCVIANEVLDAIPVQVIRWSEQKKLLERGVSVNEQGEFMWSERPAATPTADLMATRMPPLPGYISEIGLQAEAWVRSMGRWLHRGAALLIDYGFPRHEYYHPQRTTGTLMCHVQHHAHDDPFLAPGLQDITAHIDFTAMADAALAGGLEVLGFTSQARFLINAGLLDVLAKQSADNAVDYARAVAPVQMLLAETEMGELFKVLAIGREIATPLLGFQRGDRCDRL